jgi:hypothetical protein
VDLLTLEQLEQKQALPYEDVPAWGATARIRAMDGPTQDAWDRRLMSAKDKGTGDYDHTGLRAYLVALCLSDGNGERLFADADKGAEIIGRRDAKTIDQLHEVAVKLNGIGRAQLEERAKN